MAGSLGTTENTNTEDKQVVASDGMKQKEITLKAGAGSLVRGQVVSMNTTTYKWTALNYSGSTGENVARAILAEAVDASSREMKAQAYFVGKYRFDDITFPTGTRLQRDNAIKELADVGLISDEDFSTAATTTTSTTTSTSTTSSTSSTTTTTAA